MFIPATNVYNHVLRQKQTIDPYEQCVTKAHQQTDKNL